MERGSRWNGGPCGAAARGAPRPPGLESAFVDITPTRALDWLAKNTKNRPLREEQIGRYAEAMEEGRWMTSPDAIGFDTEGRLINGQHRLKAIVQSGQTIKEALVVWGLPKEAFKIADVGAKRTAADVLHIEGFKHPQELGAVMKLVVLWMETRLEEARRYEVVDKSKIVDAATFCTPRVYESSAFVHKCWPPNKISDSLPRSHAIFAHFIYKPTYPEKADRFVKAILTGKDIHDWIVTEENGEPVVKRGYEVGFDYDPEDDNAHDSPAGLMRDKILNKPDLSRTKWLAYLCQAFNWYVREEPHGRLRYRSGDRFPEPIVDDIPELPGGPEASGTPASST